MNAVISQIYSRQAVEDREGRLQHVFPVSVSHEQGSALYNVVRKTNACKTLEVGMAYGLSTLFICQALRENGGGEHVAMDPGQSTDYGSIGLLNLRRAGLDDLLKFHEERSEKVLPRLLSAGEKYDFIFIDGMHLYDYVLTDFFFADKLLKPGGYMMLDDLWMPAVRKAICFILRNRNYALAKEHWGASFGMKKRIKRIGRAVIDLVRRPIEILPLPLSFASLHHNYVVLKKLREDDRNGTHYAAF